MFLDIFSVLCLIGLIFVIFYLVARVEKYELKVEYLESVISQAVEICSNVEIKVEKFGSELSKSKQKAYFQGVEKQKKKE